MNKLIGDSRNLRYFSCFFKLSKCYIHHYKVFITLANEKYPISKFCKLSFCLNDSLEKSTSTVISLRKLSLIMHWLMDSQSGVRRVRNASLLLGVVEGKKC